MEGKFEAFPLKYFVEKALEPLVARGILSLVFFAKIELSRTSASIDELKRKTESIICG